MKPTPIQGVPKPGVSLEFKWLVALRNSPKYQIFIVPATFMPRGRSMRGPYMFYLDVNHANQEYYPEESGSCAFEQLTNDTGSGLKSFVNAVRSNNGLVIDIDEIVLAHALPRSPGM